MRRSTSIGELSESTVCYPYMVVTAPQKDVYKLTRASENNVPVIRVLQDGVARGFSVVKANVSCSWMSKLKALLDKAEGELLAAVSFVGVVAPGAVCFYWACIQLGKKKIIRTTTNPIFVFQKRLSLSP